MKKYLILIVFTLFSGFAHATPEDGDIIIINGERWSLFCKPIYAEKDLYNKLMAILPKERGISTSNWDGYIAYWSIKDRHLCLDSISVEMVDYNARNTHIQLIPRKELKKIFKRHIRGKNIVANWISGNLRAAKGLLLYDEGFSGYERYLDYETVFSVEKGRILNQQSFHNRLINDGFPGRNTESITEEMINTFFEFIVNNHPEHADLKWFDVCINDIKVDSLGNCIDCNISTRTKSHGDFESGNLAEVIKNYLKKIHPWRTYYIKGKYLSEFGNKRMYFHFPCNNYRKSKEHNI